jgi:hypothetical protein
MPYFCGFRLLAARESSSYLSFSLTHGKLAVKQRFFPAFVGI